MKSIALYITVMIAGSLFAILFMYGLSSLLNWIESNQDEITAFLWRCTTILLVPILIVIALTYMPMKWIITGEYYLESGRNARKGENFLYRWAKMTGMK